MEKAYRGRVNEIIESLQVFKEQIFELYKAEQPGSLANRDDLQIKIRGKNVIDFSAAISSLFDVILHLENVICRIYTEVTE